MSGATSRATAQDEMFRGVSDRIRERAEATAKALGTVGTAALTAIGISKFGDLFPLPPGKKAVAVLGVFLGLAGMAYVLGFFTRRLWKLNEPVIMRSEIEKMSLRGGEVPIVEEVYAEIATMNDVPTLRAYEARAHRYDHIADRFDQTTADRLRALAGQIAAEVGATLSRARLILVRQRTTDAIMDRGARLAYILFILSLLLFAGAADYLDAERSAVVTLAKSCGEARGAGATSLPEICNRFGVQKEISTEEPTGADLLAERIAGLTAAFVHCKMPDNELAFSKETCAKTREAVDAALNDVGR